MRIQWTVALVAIGCTDTGADGLEPAAADVGTPIGDPVTVVIGADGGTLESDDGGFVLTVPAGALPDDTELTLQPITNTAWGGLGDGYRVSPAIAFDVPVTVAIAYTDFDLLGTSEAALGIAAQDVDGYWLGFGAVTVDDAARTLSVETTDLGAPVPLGRGGSGSADFTKHWRVRLEPGESTVKRSGTRSLALMATARLDDPDDALAPPTAYTHTGDVAWSVDGVPAGTVKGGRSTGTYTAPSSRSAAGKKNFVTAALVLTASTKLSTRATILIDPEETTWVGTTRVNDPNFRYVTEVTWTLDHTQGTEQWFVPTGEVVFSWADDPDTCSTTPLNHEVVAEDGLLIVDGATDPPTYAGHGVTVWALTVSCPPEPPFTVPFPAAWFGDADDVLTTLGTVRKVGDVEVIEDSAEIENATITWRFEKQ